LDRDEAQRIVTTELAAGGLYAEATLPKFLASASSAVRGEANLTARRTRCDNVTIFEGIFTKSLYMRAGSKTFAELASIFVTMSQIRAAGRLRAVGKAPPNRNAVYRKGFHAWKEPPRIREWILRPGMRPHIENGVWDGYPVEDHGSGQFRAWLEGDSGPSAPDDGPRTAVLAGSLEKQMPRWLRKDFGEW
jgi:hypothetical protein